MQPTLLTLCLMATLYGAQAQTAKPCPAIDYDAVYDFQNNIIVSNPNVAVVSAPTGTGCDTQAVFKIALGDINRKRVIVDLFLLPGASGWNFNLGDSKSNNGYAGDSGSQSNDAEVQGVAGSMAGYLSDYGGSGQAFNAPNLYSTRLTLIAGDGHLVWLSDNNNNFNYYNSPYWFALNGQADSTGPVNNDLYLAANRVISYTSDRVGKGLCKIGIKFLPAF
ncbi:uncharacterized protein LOC131935223 [Physella acuta]|uniref:uncharacterized protein LOC131935223 n=1 Tax=Physella acuta TaxID=109671 RepID=UPI0027DDE381|nr:uncharacterized protein LOC131935223 [Physella acuta]